MKSLILVSKRPVVIQIFTLVCKQLHLSLEVLHEAQLDHRADIIVIDKEFISDRFNILKSYAKVIGAISKEELSFDIANDFTIPIPFIPSQLYTILDEQIELLNKRAKSKVYISNVEVPDKEARIINEYNMNESFYKDQSLAESPPINDAKNAVDYLESLADDIAFDMNKESDDSIVSINSINQGGVLDNKELSMLEKIVNDTTIEQMELEKSTTRIQESKEEQEWLDLSSIIDQAINEANMADGVASSIGDNIKSDRAIKVLINNYELEQLKPLLRLLDQNSIDMISDGNEVNLILKLDNARE